MGTAALVVAAVLVIIVVSRLVRPCGVPVPIALLVVGTALSFVPGGPEPRLSPDMVLLGLLPSLPYAAAISTSLLDLRT
jgi:monovalent cation/hydrogen antiporter